MTVRACEFVVDCDVNDRHVSDVSDVHKIHRFGGNVGSNFDGHIEVTKEMNKSVQLLQGHMSHPQTVIYVPPTPIHLRFPSM